jgi:peptide/nickel transport system permease protein
MSRYLIRRTLGAILVMWAVATLVFFMLRAVPGDPLAAMLFDVADPEAAEALRRKFGLDQPVWVQYVKWFGLVLQGDFGTSLLGSRIEVSRVLVEALPRTLSLAALSFLIATAIAVPAGLISALKRHSAFDHAVTFFAFLGLAMPEFWLAILLIIVFAANLQWLPAIGYVPLADGFWPWFSHLILPSIAIGTSFAAIIARMIRSSMLEVLHTDYMQVARSKGLLQMRLLFVHALPNALIPVVTVMGIVLALLMVSTVVVENVFAIKGLGRVLVQGIFNRDYPVVQGAILVVSAIFVFANLVVDVLYTVIDPRIRYD